MIWTVTDSGAMMCVGGEDIANDLGVTEHELVPTKLNIKVADDRKTTVKGAIFANIDGENATTGEHRRAKQMIYIVKGVKGLYLSKRCANQLGIVSNNFPKIADEKTGRAATKSKGFVASTAEDNDEVEAGGHDNKEKKTMKSESARKAKAIEVDVEYEVAEFVGFFE